MSVEIRGPGPDDYAAAVDVLSTAFLERPDVPKVAEELRGTWPADRTWIAWDDGRPCGTFRSWGTRLTVPGGRTMPAAAVSAVTVLPTHRRRGILTRMAAAEHAAVVERGETFAILYASEYPIYGRFGYAPATRSATWTVRPRETSMAGAPSGSVELAVPGPDVLPLLREVFEVARLRVAGEIWRRDVTWELDLGIRPDVFTGTPWKGFVAVRRAAGGSVDGYVRYKADPSWEHGPKGTLTVLDLHALSAAAYADLWRFLLSVDLVTSVKAEGLALDEPLPWLLANARAASVDDVSDQLWVRLFDVPAALEARTYERTASLVIEVVDDEAFGGRRRLLLDVTPDGATCRPTDRSPDLTIPVAALGGAYLGGTRLRDLVLATGCDEHRAGALAEVDALLHTADEPWCSTGF
jgi:predicted acetyltransferase